MTSALPFLIGAFPFLAYAAYSDLRTMTIPNWVSLALAGVFLVLGLIFLPIDLVAWRLAVGLIVLAVGIGVHALGLMGGGDIKLLAGIAPYVAAQTAPAFLMILSASMLVTLALHRIAKRIGPIRRATPDWKSWEVERHFPMGISISTAAILYLALSSGLA